jgi:nicotinate-nucleotide adenylyltransferase
MKIAVLGGSFNPIHIGHLALADEVCCALGYDRIVFVPTFIPPHKTFSCDAGAAARLEMANLACEDDGRFVVDSCEIDRGGTSYTFDTISFLEEKYSDCLEGKIGLIIGDDLIPGFHLWHRAVELSKKCQLILAKRPQGGSGKTDSSHANVDKGGYASVVHSTVDGEGRTVFDVKSDSLFDGALSIMNPELVVSSTDIRDRVSSGRSFKYLVPEKVFKYIIGRNIYGNDKQRDF